VTAAAILAAVTDDAAEASEAAWAAYERHLRSEDLSDRTIGGYRESVMGLAAHAGIALDLVAGAHIETYLTAERERVKKADTKGTRDGRATAAAHYRNLHAFYQWMEDRELIDGRSPMHGMKRPGPSGKVIRVPAVDDLQKLLDSMKGKTFDDRRDTAIIRLACELGGLRRGELAGIRLADLDIKRGRVLVRGKGGKERYVPFGAKTTEALMRYLRARRTHPLAASEMLWLGWRGKPLTGDGIMQMVRRRAGRAKIGHLHPHMFRHYAAAQAKRNKVPTAAARALFGWATSEMYDGVYGRFADAEDAEIMARQLAVGDAL
jgi:site-specific recombinase XerD